MCYVIFVFNKRTLSTLIRCYIIGSQNSSLQLPKLTRLFIFYRSSTYGFLTHFEVFFVTFLGYSKFGSSKCNECLPGSFANKTGSKECGFCMPGESRSRVQSWRPWGPVELCASLSLQSKRLTNQVPMSLGHPLPTIPSILVIELALCLTLSKFLLGSLPEKYIIDY